jgi:hypothetical protein
LGVISAYLLGVGYKALGFSPPWWLDTPAVFGCFAIFWRVYDKWAWRWEIYGGTLSGIVNFAGKWSGHLFSAYNGGNSIPVEIVVTQTASQILVKWTTRTSSSYSNMAMVCSTPGRSQGLRYAYSNEPNSLATNGMSPHAGICELTISIDRQSLIGYYETNRHRGTRGSVEVTRVCS